jgi:hypothetical protein
MTGLGRQAPINDCYGAQRATAAIGPRPPIRVEWGTIAFGQSGLRVGVAHIGRDEIEEADPVYLLTWLRLGGERRGEEADGDSTDEDPPVHQSDY